MLTFLLKLTFAWSLFAVLYALLLRRETFFQANRFYLLGTVAAGIVLALPGGWLFKTGADSGLATALPVITIGLEQAEEVAKQWNWLESLYIFYGAGAVLALLRMLWGLSRLVLMAMRGTKERLPDGCLLVRSADARVPFSFFHWVFVPAETAFAAENLPGNGHYASDAMLAHERAHARGWHSADVLLLELLCVVFWFHPLAHWYRRTLRTVHEYLADAEASRLTDKKQYGLLLINQAHSGVSYAFVNHFFQSPLKQRLVMLMQNASPAFKAWKYGLIPPLFVLLFLCTRQAGATAQSASPEKEVYELSEIERMPQYPGGQFAMMQFLAENIRYPDAARRDSAQGMVAIMFTIDATGVVTDVGSVPVSEEAKNRPGWRQDFYEEAVRVVSLMPKWEPGSAHGKAVKVRFTLPIRFRLQ